MQGHKLIMNKKLLLTIAYFMIAIICISCGKQKQSNDNSCVYQVYFIGDNEISYKSYEIDNMTTNETLMRLLTIMALSPDSDDSSVSLKSALSFDGGVLDAHTEASEAVINMSSAYNDIPIADEIVIRSAIVNTIVQIPGIDSVTILVDGNNLKDYSGNTIEKLTKDSFMYGGSNTIISNEMARFDLYFANKAGNRLIRVTRDVEYSGNNSVEFEIVKSIIDGPEANEIKEKSVYSSVNNNIDIISVYTENKVCFVDLTEEFLHVSKVKEDVMVYSIVNSLTELDSVNAVVIMVNGSVDAGFLSLYDNLLSANLNLINN